MHGVHRHPLFTNIVLDSLLLHNHDVVNLLWMCDSECTLGIFRQLFRNNLIMPAFDKHISKLAVFPHFLSFVKKSHIIGKEGICYRSVFILDKILATNEAIILLLF